MNTETTANRPSLVTFAKARRNDRLTHSEARDAIVDLGNFACESALLLLDVQHLLHDTEAAERHPNPESAHTLRRRRDAIMALANRLSRQITSATL